MDNSFIEKYKIEFSILLKSKPDSFFSKKKLHIPNGRRLYGIQFIEESEYQLEKKKRNLH